MRRFISAIIVIASILGPSALTAQSNPPKVTAEFPGACLKWIHVAEPEFERRKLDLGKYNISIVEGNDSVTVILSAPDAVRAARGSTGSYPGYEVEIRKTDQKVLHSNYIR